MDGQVRGRGNGADRNRCHIEMIDKRNADDTTTSRVVVRNRLTGQRVMLPEADIGSTLVLCNSRIRDGRNYQPTEHELRALHQDDVTLDQAREIDRLYDQLLASSDHQARRWH